MYTYKVMIHPNNKQETRIRRTLNKVIECGQIVFDYLNSIVKAKAPFPKCEDVRKWFTEQKTIKDNETIQKRAGMTKREMRESNLDTLFYDVSNDALKQEIKDTYKAFIRYFKKLSKYPVRKEFSNKKKSFYVDPYKIEFTNKKVKVEKISPNKKENRQVLNWLSLAEKDRIPTGVEYSNPRVVYENNRFFIVVGVQDEFAPKRKMKLDSDKVIGIDVNINEVVTSDNDHYASMKKLPSYIKAKKKFKRTQRKLSRQYLVAKKQERKLRDCKNYVKQRKIKNKWNQRMVHLQEQNMTNTIQKIIKKAPSVICVETLNVKEMKEAYNKEKEKAKKDGTEPNKEKKYVAREIQAFPFRKFLNKLRDSIKKYGIRLIYADPYYASSKTCHKCGYKKEDLKLSDRVFICPNCSLVIDRDYNAALNLKSYALKH